MQHQNILSILLYDFGLLLALSLVFNKGTLSGQSNQQNIYRFNRSPLALLPVTG